MARPWVTLERFDTDVGPIELRRRGDGDFLIAVANRILMNSRAHRSEVALAELACRRLRDARSPRVLIGGLGMGYTLRAALDALPDAARIVVAEIHPAVVDWCRNHLAELTSSAVADRRVEVKIEDVTSLIEQCGNQPTPPFDAILLDLYEGPGANTPDDDPIYGSPALRRIRNALAPHGVLAVWSEEPSSRYEQRLRSTGFAVERRRPGHGGLRHAVYLALRCD